MASEISKRIMLARREKDITQEELGALVGVTKATINKYEKGTVMNLKRDMIEKLSNALDVSPGYLMGWTDSPTNVTTNNGVIGQNSGTVTVNNPERPLSKEEIELLRIYNSLDVKGRIKLLQTAMDLEEEKY